MLRFAANLSMMYTNVPFHDRFAAAAADGFKGVEYLFPYEWPAEVLADLLRRHGLQQVLFNAPPGNFKAGERGTASLPERRDEFRESISVACHYGRTLGCSRVHVMAGIVPRMADRATYWKTYMENLAWAADQAAADAMEVLIEPINARDMPNYLLRLQSEAHEIVARLGRPNLKVQMDLYHCQISEGDVSMRLREYLGQPWCQVGHLQIAGVPDRHEPDEGELNYTHLFRVLEEIGYEGWIGCEYHPRATTSEGLDWLRAYHAD